ncbi:hypothetical protein [Salinisphaera hydrothermalis]|uniref:hypothetical protein n=1 Tax=Salinisphaera hydrothermalis TaxID=563188 RepID=UPI0012EB612B|nr:hypothetical protein [Salinisphaera hydrothermalis]
MQIFRALPAHKAATTELLPPRPTARPPGNVPYVVDNLWEWVRPSHMPCRRHAVYASPSPHLALASGADGSSAFRVDLSGQFKAAQLISNTDSKYHPECRALRRWLLRHLGQSWIEESAQARHALAPLWMPCLPAAETDEILEVARNLDTRALAEQIHYWDDIRLIEKTDDIDPEGGEIFFEPLDGYRLVPIQS